MAAALVPDEGLRAGLRALTTDPLTMRLWKNDFVPDPSSTVGSFVACTFPGYGDVPLGAFAAPTIDLVGRAVIVAPGCVFTRSASGPGEVIYGWVLIRNLGLGPTVYACQRFSSPRTFDSAGQSLVLSPLLFLGRLLV